MEKENKKVYTVNVKPSIMDAARKDAKENRRSLSSHIEFVIEKSLSADGSRKV